MKKLIVLSAIFLSTLSAIAQKGLSFDITGVNNRTIKKAQLTNLRTLGDLVSDYPVNWIDEYESVQITTVSNGKELIGWGEDDKLTAQQIKMLETADLSSDISIKVLFKDRNAVTNILKKCNMDITFTVVPENPAEFPGGKLKLDEYFRKNVMGKIPAKLPKTFKLVKARFTIDEQGQVSATKITISSGYEKLDKQLLDVIKRMPKWKAAEDADGTKTIQEFEFALGQLMEGC